MKYKHTAKTTFRQVISTYPNFWRLNELVDTQ